MAAHSVPLFDALAIFALINDIMSRHDFFNGEFGQYLVLFLLPPPHVTEQGVQAPQGLTSQSTEK